MLLPIGLAYDTAGHVMLDPDTAIQGALRHLFTTFEAAGSATAVVKAFRAAGLSFPWRHLKGPRKGEVDWQPLQHSTVLRVLHNPRYAGVFTYGRTTHRILPGGKCSITSGFLSNFHVSRLCSNSIRTRAARAMGPISLGLAVTFWRVFHRWESSAKPRSPRHLAELSSMFRVRALMSSSLTPFGFFTGVRMP